MTGELFIFAIVFDLGVDGRRESGEVNIGDGVVESGRSFIKNGGRGPQGCGIE